MKNVKSCKKLAVALIFALMISCLPCMGTSAQAAVTYDVDAAMTYAANHWNDGVGYCAEFVSRCVQAGGINISVQTGTRQCYNAVCNATGLSGVELKLNSSGQATQSLDGDILSAGDVVIQYCVTHSVYPHVLICAGYNSYGQAVYYAHNAAMNKSVYNLSKNTAYQHTSACTIVGKVIHLSSLSNTGSSTTNSNTNTQESASPMISNVSVPSTLKVGKSWTCTGKVTSSSGLYSVKGSILDANKNTVYSYTQYLGGKTSFKLANSRIDRRLYFNRLSAGIYYYQIDAVGKNWQTATYCSTAIQVGTASKPTISGAYAPSTLTKGSSWTCTGTVYSDIRLQSVKGSIVDSSGKEVYTYTVNTTAYSYKMAGSKIDRRLYFNWLGDGTYYYQISATNAMGTTTWTSNAIQIGSAAQTQTQTQTQTETKPTITISGARYPTSINYGSAFGLRGVISTDCGTLTRVTGTVYYGNSSSTKEAYFYFPNEATFDIRNTINNKMIFNYYDRGTYRYEVKATAVNGSQSTTVTLIDVLFTVQ